VHRRPVLGTLPVAQEAIGVDEDLERELQDEVLGLGKIERRKDADLAAMLSTAIAQIAAVERTGADPNALLRSLRMQRFPEWEAYVLDARSLNRPDPPGRGPRLSVHKRRALPHGEGAPHDLYVGLEVLTR